MIIRGQPILYSDLQALATLATTKLSPSTPYSFAAFAGPEQIQMPKDLVPGTPLIGDGFKNTLWLYGYKTIGGTKTFSTTRLRKPANRNSDNATWNWTWETPLINPPEGYIAVIPQVGTNPGNWTYLFKDIGPAQSLVFNPLDTSSFKQDVSLIGSYNQGQDDVPCAHGISMKTMNLIFNDAMGKLDIFGGTVPFGDQHKVSNPEVVSTSPKLYLNLNNKPFWKNPKFIYSPSDSAIGNQLSRESDMLNTYLQSEASGGVQFNWDTNGVLNGKIVFFALQDTDFSTWTFSASDPSITITTDPEFSDFLGNVFGGIIFSFSNTPYSVGTPITLTVTPPFGQGLVPPGGEYACVFTETPVEQAQTDTIAIHLAGINVKSVALTTTLANITATTSAGGVNSFESHWRSFCDGVFVASSLPTPGFQTYLDQDLPQYNPQIANTGPASSRRIPISDSSLPVIEAVRNKGTLWPIFPDSDFEPDNIAGQSFVGSKAWQVSLAKKNIQTFESNEILPSNPLDLAPNLQNFFVGSENKKIRFEVDDSNIKIYLKVGAPPTFTDFDEIFDGGIWNTPALDLSNTDQIWYFKFFNPTLGEVDTIFRLVVYPDSELAPNGVMFPSRVDDFGKDAPQLEGFTYHFDILSNSDQRPFPMYGYGIYSITVRRGPVDVGGGVKIAPSDGTEDLSVDIGLMIGFGYDAKGTFQKIQTIVIPAGQASVIVDVSLPVLSGTPLAYQSPEPVSIRARANFQPAVRVAFDPHFTTVGGDPSVLIGYYSGKPFYNPNYRQFFPEGGFFDAPGVILPLTIEIINDLESFLNVL